MRRTSVQQQTAFAHREGITAELYRAVRPCGTLSQSDNFFEVHDAFGLAVMGMARKSESVWTATKHDSADFLWLEDRKALSHSSTTASNGLEMSGATDFGTSARVSALTTLMNKSMHQTVTFDSRLASATQLTVSTTEENWSLTALATRSDSGKTLSKSRRKLLARVEQRYVPFGVANSKVSETSIANQIGATALTVGNSRTAAETDTSDWDTSGDVDEGVKLSDGELPTDGAAELEVSDVLERVQESLEMLLESNAEQESLSEEAMGETEGVLERTSSEENEIEQPDGKVAGETPENISAYRNMPELMGNGILEDMLERLPESLSEMATEGMIERFASEESGSERLNGSAAAETQETLPGKEDWNGLRVGELSEEPLDGQAGEAEDAVEMPLRGESETSQPGYETPREDAEIAPEIPAGEEEANEQQTQELLEISLRDDD